MRGNSPESQRTFMTRSNTIRSIGDTDDREKVEIYFSCRKLKKLDVFSQSDPRLILYRKVGPQWVRVGETETIMDNANPDFQKSFVQDFIFEKRQFFKVEARDIDSRNNGNYDALGSVQFEMGKLIGSVNNMLILDLKKNGAKMGSLIVRAEKVARKNDIFTLNFNCRNVTGFGLCSSLKPFITIMKPRITPQIQRLIETDQLNPNNLGSRVQWIKVYSSEKHNKDNFNLKKIRINASKLCSGRYNLPLKVNLMNFKGGGTDELRGQALITVNDFLISNRKNWKLKHPTTGEFAGDLNLRSHKKEINYPFIDYLRGGTEINVICCIDFTGSNLFPNNPSSLHYIRSLNLDGQLNDYQLAILSVCQILLNYDHDKLIPTYGFGAKPYFMGMQETSHFFPLSGDYQRSSAQGVEGVFQLYNSTLRQVEFSGPTLFQPLLKEVRLFTEANFQRNNNTYSVLLILTDGVIHDMSATIDEIVAASKLPLSIIIIGVGNEDFSQMEALDSDNHLLRGNFGTASRDIVQFVPFKKFRNKMHQGEALAQSVLEELPHQVTSFYRSINKAPMQAPTKKESDQVYKGLNGLIHNRSNNQPPNGHQMTRGPVRKQPTNPFNAMNMNNPPAPSPGPQPRAPVRNPNDIKIGASSTGLTPPPYRPGLNRHSTIGGDSTSGQGHTTRF